MTTVEVQLTLPEDVLEYLQNQASSRKVSLGDVVGEVLTDYLAEPTKEEILESMRQSLIDGLAGRVRPAREALAELKKELGIHDDEG